MDNQRPEETFMISCLLFSLRFTPSKMLWRMIRRKYYMVFLGVLCGFVFLATIFTSRQSAGSENDPGNLLNIQLEENDIFPVNKPNFESRDKNINILEMNKSSVLSLPKQEEKENEDDDLRKIFDDLWEEKKEEKASVVINGRFRTGSSFIGSLFQYHPKVHYAFEPLQFYALPFGDARQNHLESVAEMRLREILSCRYENLVKDVISFGAADAGRKRIRKWWPMTFCRNKDLKRTLCERNITKVLKTCRKAQHHVIKEITLSNFSSLAPLMKEGVKVIHLVRDPRGQINSILKLYGNGISKTYSPHFRWKMAEICADLRRTFKAVHEIFQKDKSLLRNYKLVRYEEVALSPIEKAKEIYKFTNIEVDEGTLNKLRVSTNATKGGTLSITRNSTSVPFAWVNNLWPELLQIAHIKCCDVLHMLGYPRVDSEEKIDIDKVQLEDVRFTLKKPYNPKCPYEQGHTLKPFLILS